MMSPPSYAFNINGQISSWFNASTGLRQGCPLSPVLFVIALETLSNLLHHASDRKTIHGVRLSEGARQLTHLFFADDILICFRLLSSNCLAVKEVLEDFCKASGQKINESKSQIVVSAASSETLNTILNIFNFEHIPTLENYLGVPIVKGTSNLEHYSGLQAKISKKLAGWKANMLSMPGRICLVNSSVIPCIHYTFKHCKVPKNVINWMNKQIRDFIWGHPGKNDKKHRHLIAWSDMCCRKDFGGGGVQDIEKWYYAMAFQQAVQILTEPENIWVRSI